MDFEIEVFARDWHVQWHELSRANISRVDELRRFANSYFKKDCFAVDASATVPFLTLIEHYLTLSFIVCFSKLLLKSSFIQYVIILSISFLPLLSPNPI